MADDATSRTIRSTAGLVWLVVVALGAAVLLIDVLVRGDLGQVLLVAPWMLLVVWIVWAFLAAPRLIAGERAVLVRNPLRTVEVPWGAIDGIELRWQLELRLLDAQRLQVWSVAARRAPRRGADGDSPRAGRDQEVLADLEALRAERRGAAGSVRIRWNLDVLLVLAALVAWAAIAVAVTR